MLRKVSSYLRMCTSSLIGAALLVAAAPAGAFDITFSRNAQEASPSGNTSDDLNLQVILSQQSNAADTATTVRGECRINWSATSCTISNFPATTNALVTVFHLTSPSFGQYRQAIGKIQFWINITQDAEIHIPTGTASFKADVNWSTLFDANCCDIAILSQGDLEMGESFSDRPNGGQSYFGQKVTNCGTKQLASDQADTCVMDFLAGCYSPVFAMRIDTANKNPIFVNKTDSGPADHVLCIEDGETTDYVIKTGL